MEKLGDAYIFLGFERNPKLILVWLPGRRTHEDTLAFTSKLARATSDDSFQITTEGFSPYRGGSGAGRSSYEKSTCKLGHQYIILSAGAKRLQFPVVQTILHIPVVQLLLQHHKDNHQQLPRRCADRLACSFLSLLRRIKLHQRVFVRFTIVSTARMQIARSRFRPCLVILPRRSV